MIIDNANRCVFSRAVSSFHQSNLHIQLEVPDETLRWPVALIQREEHDGTRRYYIEEQEVRIVSGTTGKDGSFVPGEKEELRFPREDYGDAAELVLHLLKNVSGEEVEVTEGLEAFLDAVNIFDLEAKTEDRTDFSVAFWHPEAPLTGFNVRCRLTPMNPLLDGGRTANLKLEQSGVKFAVPTVNKVNALPESSMEVAERMMMIERLGGVLKYADVADRVFRCNLLMIDLHFPRMLAEMVRLMHLDGITRISELTERIKEMNPLKIKDELINKHRFSRSRSRIYLSLRHLSPNACSDKGSLQRPADGICGSRVSARCRPSGRCLRRQSPYRYKFWQGACRGQAPARTASS